MGLKKNALRAAASRFVLDGGFVGFSCKSRGRWFLSYHELFLNLFLKVGGCTATGLVSGGKCHLRGTATGPVSSGKGHFGGTATGPVSSVKSIGSKAGVVVVGGPFSGHRDWPLPSARAIDYKSEKAIPGVPRRVPFGRYIGRI